MKYVYVLTSALSDLYYEQFFLSVTSMRMYNPDACVVLLTDTTTKKNLTGKRAGYAKLITEEKVISVPDSFNKKESSRWIKTSINRYVEGKFLFIDCDTIITGALAASFSDSNFPDSIKVGAVLDCHVPLSKHNLQFSFQNEDKNVNFVSSLLTDKRYNGGVIYCNGESKEGIDFFERWHNLWLKTCKMRNSQDMPSLNQANYELNDIITPLDDALNCQISHNGLPYLCAAKIIHYYATSLVSFDHPYLLASKAVLLSIKDSGVISPDIMELLKKPTLAFSEKVRIIADKTAIDVLESAFFSKLLWLRRNHGGGVS
ncbi:MAG: hypothetical protein Ta2A_17590 [Treponemataceae bacterium]|nr:MAG: hypothetical protein Ta2A_17590 [Treponemataceae bacterium]